VQIYPPATVNAGPDQVLCGSGDFQLAGQIGGGATQATWTASVSGGQFLPNANTLQAIYVAPSGVNSVVLTLTTNDPAGPCLAVSDQMVVSVNTPVVANAGLDEAVCGNLIQLTGSPSGGTWTGGQGQFGNKNNAQTTYTATPAEMGTTVVLTWTVPDPDGDGPCIGSSDEVNISFFPPVVVQAGPNQVICEGGTASLVGSISGGASSGRWSANVAGGTFMPNDQSLSATYIPPSGYIGSILLTLTSIDPNGPCQAASSSLTLTINPAATVEAGENRTVCVGYSVPLSGTIGGGASSGTWNASVTGGSFSPNANSLTATYTPPSNFTGAITITLTTNDPSGPCPAKSDDLTVTVVPDPSVSISPSSAEACLGGSVTLTASPSGGTGTCTLQWQSSRNGTSAWTDIIGATNTTYAAPASALGTLYYRAIYSCTGSSCDPGVSNTAAVTVAPDPTVSISPTSSNVCIGGQVTLRATTTGGAGTCTIQWQSSPNNTQNWTNIPGANQSTYVPSTSNTGSTYYRVVYSCSGGGCDPATSNLAVVNVYQPATVSITPSSYRICPGGNITFTATSTNSIGSCTFQWQSSKNGVDGWADISGATGFQYIADITETGTVYFRATYVCAAGGCGTAVSNVATVEVTPGPSVSIFTSSPTTVCVGGNVLLRALPSDGAGNCSLQWQSSPTGTGDWTNIPRATNSNYTPPTATAGTTYYRAIYNCTGAECGSSASNVISVTVAPDPSATITPSSSSACVGERVVLTATPAGGAGTCTIQWQSSASGTDGWSNISGATKATFLPPSFTMGTVFYRVTYSCTGGGCDASVSNTASVTIGSCAQPDITLVKDLVSVAPAANGRYTVTYTVTVKNTGGATGQYTLKDTPLFDDDVTIHSGNYSGQASGQMNTGGSTTLAANASIGAGLTHTYTVSFEVSLNLSAGSTDGGDNVYTACAVAGNGPGSGPGQGLYNKAELDTNNDGTPERTDDACGDLPNITLVKDLVSVAPAANGRYTVTYTIAVKNTGGATGQYTLKDTPLFDDDVTIHSGNYSGQASGQMNTGGSTTLAANASIGAGLTHTYTVSFEVSLNLSAGSTDGGDNVYTACAVAGNGPGSGPGQGLYNKAELDTNNDGTPEQTDDACGDLPNITLVKDLVSVAPAANGRYTVTYTVTVKNTGGATGQYTLKDTPLFDDDVTIHSGNYSGQASGQMNTGGSTTLAANASIGAGLTHTYTVSFEVSLNLSAGSTDGGDNVYTACAVAGNGPGSGPGQGLYNKAELDTNNDGTPEQTDDACGDLPNITLVKDLVSVAPAANGRYTVTYTVTVKNTGGATGQYTLKDTPLFDDDVTIHSGNYSGQASGQMNTGGSTTLAANASIGAGLTHAYTVSFEVSLNLSAGSTDGGDNVYTACAVAGNGPGSGPGQGLYNKAELDTNNDGTPERTDDACGDLPNITLVKDLVSVAPAANGRHTVTYTVTVKNTGGATGQYTLKDTPLFDDDVTIHSGNYSGQASGQMNTGGSTTLAANASIGAGLTHTYTVSFEVSLNLSAGSTDGGDNVYTACAVAGNGPGSGPGQGLYNKAELDTNNDGTPERTDDACGDLPQCDLKVAVSQIQCNNNGTPANPNDDTFTFSVLATGSGQGWKTTVKGLEITGSYGVLKVFGPYKISEGNISLTVADQTQAGCTSGIVVVNAPQTCSGEATCNISGTAVTNVLCNNKGTPSDPSDDTFTFELTVNGTGASNTWVANDAAKTTGKYGVKVVMGPYKIADGDVNLILTDKDDARCEAAVYVPVPRTCSNECAIATTVTDVVCNDQNTSDPSDDTFTFSLTVTGGNAPQGWIATDGKLTTGNYGQPTVFGPFKIASGPVAFDVIDLQKSTCRQAVKVDPPQACSAPDCDIATAIINAVCNDNNTPSDPSDDMYSFELVVTGGDAGGQWTANDPASTKGAYGVPVQFGPYKISEGDRQITIRDSKDANCKTIAYVAIPKDCSGACSIQAVAVDTLIDKKGTPALSDDTWTLIVRVTGKNNSTVWVASDGIHPEVKGFYGSEVAFGPYSANQGKIVIAIRDLFDPACRATLEFNLTRELPECPYPVSAIKLERKAQIWLGTVDEADAETDPQPGMCGWPEITLPAGKRYEDVISFKTPQPAASVQKYTFVLMTQKLAQDLPLNFSLFGDGTGGIYADKLAEGKQDCERLLTTCKNPESYLGAAKDTSFWKASILDHTLWRPAMQFTVELPGGKIYQLKTSSLLPGAGGDFAWVIVPEDQSSELELLGDQVELFSPAFRTRDLVCADLQVMLNNPASLNWVEYLPVNAEKLGIVKTEFKDVLHPDGTCGLDTLIRTYTYTLADSSTVTCSQMITARKARLQEVAAPACHASFSCDEPIAELDAQGHPHPSVTGYPFLVTALQTELLNESACNLKATYTDQVDSVCANTYRIHRLWTLIDACEPDSVRYMPQTILIGDFKAPVVSCPPNQKYCPVWDQNMLMYLLDPFECTATFEAPLPTVEDGCSGTYSILTEILKIQIQYGIDPVDGTADTLFTYLVIDTILPGQDRTVSQLAAGEYYFRYTVKDACGNQTTEWCRFRVMDLETPVAICNDRVNVSLNSLGLARLTLRHIDGGSYDNCGIQEIQLRRKFTINPQTGDSLAYSFYSDWGKYVDFNCLDAGSMVEVQMQVIDSAGNANMCWTKPLVEDKLAPYCYGLNDTTVTCAGLPDLFNPLDTAHLKMLFGSAVVHDNCGGFARELAPAIDTTTNGQCRITRFFIAEDYHGNVAADTARQQIVLQADGVCSACKVTSKASIQGKIVSLRGLPIPGVEVSLNGPSDQFTDSDIKGSYLFRQVEAGHDYSVVPYLDKDHRNGVTTLDITLITRHILGIAPFDDPRKFIAADVNNSKSVTVSDVLNLRKLVLGEWNHFPNNTSWRFLDAGFQFPDPSQPWNQDLPELVSWNDLPEGVSTANFTGIKVGDIDGSVALSSGGLTNRSSERLIIEAQDVPLLVGKEVEVTLSRSPLQQVGGYQFTLRFDPAAVRLTEVIHGEVQAEHLGFRYLEDGLIAVSWNNPDAASLNANTGPVVRLKFRALRSGRLSEALELNSRITPAMAFDAADKPMGVELAFVQPEAAAAEWKLYQNYPNPYQGETVIRFDLPEAGPAILEVRDVQGRLLWRTEGQYEQGANEVRLKREWLERAASGVLFYTLNAGNQTKTLPMVLMPE
jgi:hypothetical protein